MQTVTGIPSFCAWMAIAEAWFPLLAAAAPFARCSYMHNVSAIYNRNPYRCEGTKDIAGSPLLEAVGGKLVFLLEVELHSEFLGQSGTLN